MTKRPIRAALAFALATVLPGCSAWHRLDEGLAQPRAARDRVQLWIGTRAYEVRSVSVRGDSVSAVPSWQPPTCDSCRLHFALADVDSVRAQDTSGGTILIGGVAVVALIILYLRGGLASNYP
jgi:hypothetical protein